MTRAARTAAEARVCVRIAMQSGAQFVCVVTPEPTDDDLTPREVAVKHVRTHVANGDLLRGVWADSDHRSQVTPLERACARALGGDSPHVEWLSPSAVESIGAVNYTPRT
jgi:hypothetical protein